MVSNESKCIKFGYILFTLLMTSAFLISGCSGKNVSGEAASWNSRFSRDTITNTQADCRDYDENTPNPYFVASYARAKSYSGSNVPDDHCSNDIFLLEYSCSSKGKIVSESVNCKSRFAAVCSKGACLIP